mmetsp:Transcript_13345/g.25088  ORF Transcript_13345/g.25088 Transcript_13345/m.25088 type:complete len:304 (+) Transcript_13345:118-1029(+)
MPNASSMRKTPAGSAPIAASTDSKNEDSDAHCRRKKHDNHGDDDDDDGENNCDCITVATTHSSQTVKHSNRSSLSSSSVSPVAKSSRTMSRNNYLYSSMQEYVDDVPIKKLRLTLERGRDVVLQRERADIVDFVHGYADATDDQIFDDFRSAVQARDTPSFVLASAARAGAEDSSASMATFARSTLSSVASGSESVFDYDDPSLYSNVQGKRPLLGISDGISPQRQQRPRQDEDGASVAAANAVGNAAQQDAHRWEDILDGSSNASSVANYNPIPVNNGQSNAQNISDTESDQKKPAARKNEG